MTYPTIKDLSELIRAYKSESREYGELDITIGWSPEDGSWNYQTGCNEFTGGAYGYPVWAVETITPNCNSVELARALKSQLQESQWA